MRDRVCLFTHGSGIGDALYVASATEVLVASDPTREYGAALSADRKAAWWRLIFRDAPFRVWTTFPTPGWRAIRCTPIQLGFHENVVDAHARTALGKARIRLVSIRRPRPRPAYFGPRPRTRTDRVGVFAPPRWRIKLWQKADALVEALRVAGVRAEPTPPTMSPEEGAEWIGSCRLFVGSETGLTHLAAALEVPVVMVLGGRFDAGNFGWAGTSHVTTTCPRGPCRAWRRGDPPPCLGSPFEGAFPCLEAVSVEAVAAEVLRRLEEP